MLLKTVYIRFYRSFNYDYLRKNHLTAPAKAKPWEMVENAFFPYVRIPIDVHVTTVVGANESGKGVFIEAITKEIEEFEANMLMLLTKLRAMQKSAEKEQNSVRVSEKVDRLKKGFLQDHPDEASREQAALILKEIEEVLDDSRESDIARSTVQNLRRDFQLGKDLFQPVQNYPNFKTGLEQIKYAGVIASQEMVNAGLASQSPSRQTDAEAKPLAQETKSL